MIFIDVTNKMKEIKYVILHILTHMNENFCCRKLLSLLSIMNLNILILVWYILGDMYTVNNIIIEIK